MSSITDNLNTSLSSLVSHFAAFLKNRDIQSLCLEKTVSGLLFSFPDSALSGINWPFVQIQILILSLAIYKIFKEIS